MSPIFAWPTSRYEPGCSLCPPALLWSLQHAIRLSSSTFSHIKLVTLSFNVLPPGCSILIILRVQSESVLIQKIFTHFKKAPGTHKLGILYALDSVVRKWQAEAKRQNQNISTVAPDGTFAAGVVRVRELMPILMDDITSSAPEDQKVRLQLLFQDRVTFRESYVVEEAVLFRCYTHA